MRKVLFILHYPPPVHGAAMVGQYIRESDLINGTFDCRYINLGTSVKIDEIGQGGWQKWRRYFKIIWHTLHSLYRLKPDLVYITLTASGPGFYKDALVALLAKTFGKKVVYHFHNKGVSNCQDRWFDNTIYQIVFKNTDVILLSKQLYPDIKKYVPKERVHYCANGIPNNRIKNLERKQKNSNEMVQILFLSNLIGSKGVYTLLEACQLLQRKKIHFECAFVGGEGDISSNELQQKIQKMGLKELVNYQGPKYGAEKEASLVLADIFALPTYYPNECFPLVLLEAMQYSLPIVSTFEGGIPDIVEDGKTGYLLQPRDPEAFADKLEKLIKDPALRIQMGQNGSKQYEEQFTLEAFEKRFTKIMKILVK